MKKSDFNYELPNELIARYPLKKRTDSRLLVVGHQSCSDKTFSNIVDIVSPGDLLVFNNTRVIAARLFGKKTSGGKIEVLIERVVDDKLALAHIRSSKSPKPGAVLMLEGDHQCTVNTRVDDLFELSFTDSIHTVLDSVGHMPLPPYIDREDESLDLERYQTVYSEKPGAVAAPTAGLHFDDALINQLTKKQVDIAHVTLHVGSGTFQPVRTENLDEHIMHKEWLTVSQAVVDQIINVKKQGGRVIAVGTTAMRSLESAAASGELKPYEGDTDLFITPGYQFNVVDAMITNFHLPESTLLMLVSAFSGYQRIRDAYDYAIKERYRFFSYGDAMFLNYMQDKA